MALSEARSARLVAEAFAATTSDNRASCRNLFIKDYLVFVVCANIAYLFQIFA